MKRREQRLDDSYVYLLFGETRGAEIKGGRKLKKVKRGLALLLVVLLALSTVSMVAFADGAETADEVIYNLGKLEVTVGSDTAKAAVPWNNYKLFDEYGDYTIVLENNAFFPYEVQFKANGMTSVEWFESPDSVIYVGGHAFSVFSEQNDETKLSQIGLWVGGDYIAVRPEPKTFTNSMISPASLLPLTEVSFTLSLAGYTPAELRTVALSAVLSGQGIVGNPKVVWVKKSYSSDTSGDYKIANYNDKIDISPRYSGNENVYLELIVGDANQLNPSNTRYIITIKITSIDSKWLDFELYKQDGLSVRTEVVVYNIRNETYYEPPMFNLFADLKDIYWGEDAYLGINWGSSYATEKAGTEVEVYKGIYYTEAEITAAAANNITSLIWNQDMSIADNGYPANYSDWYNQNEFTVVMKEGGVITGIAPFTVYLNLTDIGVRINDIYETATETDDSIGWESGWNSQNGVRVLPYRVNATNNADASHYLRMIYEYHGDWADWSNNTHVERAVLGHYDTEEEVVAQPDIKGQLFPLSNTGGYYANYSGAGMDFTVLDEFGVVLKFTVKAEQMESTENLPTPGRVDPYFQVTGAVGLSNSFYVPSEHDSYYSMGYQTVFYIGDVPLDGLIPFFYTSSDTKIYAGSIGAYGEEQMSGTTVADFSRGAVQYAAVSTGGRGLRNYWVTFVKRNESDAELFVNGINGGDVDPDTGYPVREVFLTDMSNYGINTNFHDIFIANVGIASLTSLSVTLENAQNIKLDPYWTVGGAGNDELAAFTTTNTSATDYGLLPNVAKIRILPDGEGEVSGTLTISADGQKDVVIVLTGYAGNPKLTTESIPPAVKYVPYAVQILNNNKYTWNETMLQVISGSLPLGMTFRPNGELYGAPRETGTFTFTVQMINSDSRFSTSTATYTLVVNDNTNANVSGSTSPGYEITQTVGTLTGGNYVITSAAIDYDFISLGEYVEFIDFWLDGMRLTDGTDYTSQPGSTKITIRAQTVASAGTGSHTIAAEFRVNGDENQELKVASQNYVYDPNASLPQQPSGGGGGGVYDQPPAITPQTPDEPSAKVEDIFKDIIAGRWYIRYVQWAYDNGYMIGVSEDLFDPSSPQTQAVIFTVLARLAGIDLLEYADQDYDDIPDDQWYSNSAKWAKSIGLMDGDFDAESSLQRGDFAVILVKFLVHMDVDTNVNGNDVVFKDADEMSEESLRAFQILYILNIFDGYGDMDMRPHNSTSRAELATLIFRVSDYVNNSKD